MQTCSTTIHTPIGFLRIAATEKGIHTIERVKGRSHRPLLVGSSCTEERSPIPSFVQREVTSQLEKYFAGKQQCFTVALDTVGTVFQKKVWAATAHIPFGTTVTYEEIARRIGTPKAVRAVGTALKKNPVCIVVPCHRVTPKSGGIGQFALGTKAKEWLLRHECRSSTSASS